MLGKWHGLYFLICRMGLIIVHHQTAAMRITLDYAHEVLNTVPGVECSTEQQKPLSLFGPAALTFEVWASVTVESARGSGGPVSPCPPQGSSSSDSLEGQSCDYASKSYDAVVFDVLKVTPEEFAVSVRTGVGGWAPPQDARGRGAGVVMTAHSRLLKLETTHVFTNRGLMNKVFFMNTS